MREKRIVLFIKINKSITLKNCTSRNLKKKANIDSQFFFDEIIEFFFKKDDFILIAL